MKKFLRITLCISILVLFATTSFAKQVTQTMPVKGWMCQECASKTEAEVKKVEGVQEVKTDLEKGELTVTFDDEKVDREKIAAAVAKAGYSCPMAEEKKSEEKKS